MSVLGVGLDLIEIDSFDEQISVTGSTFIDGTFTAAEQTDAADAVARASDPTAGSRRLAGRFAAKEAFLKAWSMARLGRAPAMSDLRLAELEVLNDRWGRPFIRPSGDAGAAVVESLGGATIHLSITHDGPMAAAVVVIGAAP